MIFHLPTFTFPLNTVTVSYTHLDVYKRQDLLLLNQKERNYYWNNVYLFTQLFSYFAYQHKDDEDYILSLIHI